MAKRKAKLPASRAADMPAVLQRFTEGESLADIAHTYHVSRQAIYQWILGGLGDDSHHELVTKALTSRVADADGTLEGAESALDIARARERMRFTRMDLERRRPALYGAKPAVDVTINVDMAAELAAARARVYEHEPKPLIDKDS